LLCLQPAEDVKAIEVARGVITSEGGFSSHAPVVARSLGKVAMVQPEIKRLEGIRLHWQGKPLKKVIMFRLMSLIMNRLPFILIKLA